jgi:hypothetical protein
LTIAKLYRYSSGRLLTRQGLGLLARAMAALK